MKRMILRMAGASLCLAVLFTGCAGSGAASSAASSAVPTPEPTAHALTDTFKASDQYDYAGFTYSQNIDETGLWSGVAASGAVTLPEGYDAITIPAAEVTPTDADIASGVNSIVSQYAAAASGDTVNIDYVGTVNGVEFQGGNTQGAGYDLTLGSGQFIDGFEDQIIGHKVGDTFDVNVTFPDGYKDSQDAAGNPITLSGTAAVFSVTINSISYGWALTDDWVAANLAGEPYNVSTVEALNAYESGILLDRNKENYVVSWLVSNSTYADPLPETVLDYMVCRYLYTYNDYADYYGISLSEYFAAVGYDSIDAVLAEYEQTIVDGAKSSLVQQAVAEAQGLSVTDDERTAYAAYTDTFGTAYIAQFALDRQVKAWLLARATVA